MSRLRFAVPLLALGMPPALAELCPAWAEPEMIGTLDTRLLPEASGMEVSADGSRTYLINDGARPQLFVAGPDGSIDRQIEISGFRPDDLEDLALGPCAAGSCLYFADIGDNARRRDTVQFAVVAEDRLNVDTVSPLRIIVARYPDGPHDAEGIAIHPVTGDLWLATKSPVRRSEPAGVYRLTAAELAAEGTQTFEHAGDIPVSSLGTGSSLLRLVTAMDISPDGGRFALLTYGAAIEFAIDLGAATPSFGNSAEGQTHRSMPIAQLIQAEAIAYSADGRALIYTTESIAGSASPLARNVCHEAGGDVQ